MKERIQAKSLLFWFRHPNKRKRREREKENLNTSFLIPLLISVITAGDKAVKERGMGQETKQ